jgi:hypothetical protein
MPDPVTALIGGGASLLSGVLSSGASEDAADAQVEAADTSSATQLQMNREGLAQQLKMYEQGRADTAPWRETGTKALNALWERVQRGPGEYTSSPGYAFRVGEGQKAIDRSAAARGGLLSGRAIKEGTRYAEDYATNDYQNWLANYYASLTPLQSVSGVGQTTAAQGAANANQVGGNIASNATQVGTNVGANILAAGNAQAAGSINQSNAITSGVNSGMNNYLLFKYLNGGSNVASPSYTYNPQAYEVGPYYG